MRLVLLCAMLLLAGCVKPDAPDTPTETPGEAVVPAAEQEPAPADPTPPTPEPTPATPQHTHAPSGQPAPQPPASAPPAPRVEVLSWTGSFTGGGMSPPAGPACCLWHAADGENTNGAFDVAAGLTGIVVELDAQHEQFDLDLQLLGADYAENIPPAADGSTHSGHVWYATSGAPGSPDVARVDIQDAEALGVLGTWGWRLGAKGPAVDAPFTLYVSLFRDAPAPAGYTAVPPAA